MKQQKRGIQGRYAALAQLAGIPTALLSDSPQQWLEAVEQVEKEARQKPDTYPLLGLIPPVSAVLKWLAAQPHTEELPVRNFQYTLVKRPDFTHKKDHYKVRVVLEYDEALAQGVFVLKDLLKQPNPFVDGREEVTVVQEKNGYKLSFYLQDRTYYL